MSCVCWVYLFMCRSAGRITQSSLTICVSQSLYIHFMSLLSGIVNMCSMPEMLIRSTNKLCRYCVFYIQAPVVLKFIMNSDALVFSLYIFTKSKMHSAILQLILFQSVFIFAEQIHCNFKSRHRHRQFTKSRPRPFLQKAISSEIHRNLRDKTAEKSQDSW